MAKEGSIILARHGRTAWNKARYTGWEDIPLDAVGKQQAEAMMQALSDREINGIYSSPLQRAFGTVSPLAEARQLTISISDRIKEINFGQWQGAFKADRKSKVYLHHQYDPFPGGESLFDLYQRAGEFVAALKDDFAAGRHLLIAGHFLINKMLYAMLCKIPFEELRNKVKYKPENGSLFEMKYRVDEDRMEVTPIGFILREGRAS